MDIPFVSMRVKTVENVANAIQLLPIYLRLISFHL